MRAHGRSSYIVALLAVIVAAGTLSCRDRDEPTAASPRLAVAEIPPDRTGINHLGEEQFVELARTAPSHAGWVLEDKGRTLVLYLTDLAESETAANAVRSIWNRDRARGRSGRPMPALRIRPATYSFLELREWRNLLILRGVLDQPGVTKLDLAEQSNRVKIGLESDAYRGRLLKFATQAGVPAKAIDFEVTGEYVPTQGSYPTLLSTIRPLQSGTVIWRTDATQAYKCTLGFTGYLGPEGVDTLPVFLTASHCGPRPMAVDSVLWFQADAPPRTPLDTLNSLIGHEIVDSAGFPCPTGQKTCSYADVAVNRLTTANWAFRRVAKTHWGCSPICDLTDPWTWVIDTLDSYYVVDGVHSMQFVFDEVVQKIGAGTAWTGWGVTDTCAHVTWGNYVWLCQVEAGDMASDAGDSGAPLLTDVHFQDSTVVAGGIVIGKGKKNNTTVFTPWPNIAVKYPELRVF